jgi:phage-related protein (TIGR01555 family)
MPVAINNQQKSWAVSLVKDMKVIAGQAFDSFVNPLLSLGMGGGNALGSGFFINPVAQNFNWLKLRAMYGGNFICRRLIEMQAEDMTREGIQIKGDIEPDKIKAIMSNWSGLGLQKRLFETICMARLYGGAIAVLDIEGQLLSTPLDLTTIRKDQFKGLKMLDRWQLWPSTDDYDPIDNMPNYYTVLSPYDWDMQFPNPSDYSKLQKYQTEVIIHRSRVIRCDGDFLPFIDFLQNQRWHSSVLVNPMDVITSYLTASAALASAAYKSSFRVVKIDNMYEVVNQGLEGQAANNLMGFIQAMKITESTENVTVLSTNDSIEILNYDLTGLLAAQNKFENQLCTLSGAPATKFMGETAQGLNATGEENTRMYYDKVKDAQEGMRPDYLKLLKVMYISTLGEQPPADLNFEFVPLWQLDLNEKSVINQQTTASIVEAFSSGLVSKETATQELLQSSEGTGVWSNITDEDLRKAKEEDEAPPEPSPEMIKALAMTGQTPSDDKLAPADKLDG